MTIRKILASTAGAFALSAALIPATSSAASFSATQRGGRILLGSTAFLPRSVGYGTVAPRTISNGGDRSGVAKSIHWQHWGQSTAIGWGLTSLQKPDGSYYPGLVKVEFRASRISWDMADGARAYMLLQAREPSQPGGPLGPWFEWVSMGQMCN